MKKIQWSLFGLIVLSAAAGAQQNPPKWIAEGPYLEAGSHSFELPLERLATKLLVEVEIGGAPRRFVFDTGSPSMMSRLLAAELGLESVGKSQGKDSHGALIESEIVQVDMNLGGTTFHRVPVFVADFSSSKIAPCMFDGVLGSEVLPSGAAAGRFQPSAEFSRLT